MRSGKNSSSPIFIIALCLAWGPSLFAATYTQSEFFDLLLDRDGVLTELQDHLSNGTLEKGRLHTVRNPEIRYSYGEGSDDILEEGVRLNRDRDAWEADIRVFIPNPYEISAFQAEAEAHRFGIQAAAQRYLSRKLVRVRELWAELRYTSSMKQVLSELAEFWESAGRSLELAAVDNLSLGPDLLSWQMDRFEFIALKQDIESRFRNAQHRLASLAGIHSDDLEPLFQPLAEAFTSKRTARVESAALLDQKSRVARERAAWAELRGSTIPWLEHVQGSYGELTSDFDRESWSVQVAVSLPVFSILSSEASEQHARVIAEEASLKLIQQEEQDAMFAAWERMGRKARILELYDAEILPLIDVMKDHIRNRDVEAGISIGQKIGLADSILRTLESYHDLQLELEKALIELDMIQGIIP